MNNVKEETFENFKIKYKKHVFSKSIKITLRKEGSILVTLPLYCPYKTARDFLLKNFEKIASFSFKKQIYSPDFKTKFDTLKILKSSVLKIEKNKNIIFFYYPENKDFNCAEIQNKLKEAVLIALRIEAKNYLPQRLKFLAQKYGFKFNKIALKNQKTRFGSCSWQNNINLNINLMNFDFDVIDYVLIHELVHTKIKNHSAAFWHEVEKYCPDYGKLRKILKNTSLG